MSQGVPENIFGIIAWLGGACFCGVMPLLIAAVLFFSARKRGQAGSAIAAARRTTAVALQAGPGLARLQGRIAEVPVAIDGPAETALAYLRLKVEVYESDGETSGWRGLTDKARGIPFRLEDGSGSVWVRPEGMDKQLLGDPFTPDEHQVSAACILLGIDPRILRGQLRFSLWEMRRGQALTVIGGVAQGASGLEIVPVKGQPFVVSPLMGPAVDAKVTTQKNTARTWTLVFGIVGGVFFLCGLTGALVTLIRTLIPS